MTPPPRYIAHYADGSRHDLEATSKAGATLAALELFGAGLARVTEEGEWQPSLRYRFRPAPPRLTTAPPSRKGRLGTATVKPRWLPGR
jgi:hypothetical protein